MKAKPFILIALTLFIGLVGGFMLGSYSQRSRIQKVRGMMMDSDRFVHILTHDLQLDPATRDQVLPLLESHHARMREIGQTFRSTLHDEMSQLKDTLGDYLTPAQLDQLDRLLRTRPPGPPRGHDGHHPRRHRQPGLDGDRPPMPPPGE
ncbi:MAG: hypothetical protein OHK0039_43650 [Bacteroidia bacterium]